jgi:hypothetical protein
MNREAIAAVFLGYCQLLHKAAVDLLGSKWRPVCVAFALIVMTALVGAMFLPLGADELWWALPTTVSCAVLSWAAFWPLNCATWFGWVAMLFRLLLAMLISNLAWAFSAVFQ